MTDARTWRLVRWSVIAALIIAPLIAMQFTEEVNWSPYDFAAATLLLAGGGLVYEVLARRTASPRQRLGIGAAVIAVTALLWAQGAVGVF